jgi:hypothetical protein
LRVISAKFSGSLNGQSVGMGISLSWALHTMISRRTPPESTEARSRMPPFVVVPVLQ